MIPVIDMIISSASTLLASLMSRLLHYMIVDADACDICHAASIALPAYAQKHACQRLSPSGFYLLGLVVNIDASLPMFLKAECRDAAIRKIEVS